MFLELDPGRAPPAFFSTDHVQDTSTLQTQTRTFAAPPVPSAGDTECLLFRLFDGQMRQRTNLFREALDHENCEPRLVIPPVRIIPTPDASLLRLLITLLVMYCASLYISFKLDVPRRFFAGGFSLSAPP